MEQAASMADARELALMKQAFQISVKWNGRFLIWLIKNKIGVGV